LINEQFLADSPLFRNLSPVECAQVLMIGQMRTYRAGDVLFREGDPGDGMFIIVDGAIRISKQTPTGEEALSILETKAFFGEMALIDYSNRAADAIAHTQSDVFFIPLPLLRDLIEAYPPIAIKFLYALCEVLAQRLRDTNERYMNVFTIAQWGGAQQGGIVPYP